MCALISVPRLQDGNRPLDPFQPFPRESGQPIISHCRARLHFGMLIRGYDGLLRDKPKGWARRQGAAQLTLGRLKPDQAAAVLRRLLEAHRDLASEAEEMARSLLHQVDYQEVAEIEYEILAQDYEDLNAVAGRHEWGYPKPLEAAGKPSSGARALSGRSEMPFGTGVGGGDARSLQGPSAAMPSAQRAGRGRRFGMGVRLSGGGGGQRRGSLDTGDPAIPRSSQWRSKVLGSLRIS